MLSSLFWIRTRPILLLVLFFFFLLTLFKKAYGSIISNWIGMKFGKIIQGNKCRLTELDFWYDNNNRFV